MGTEILERRSAAIGARIKLTGSGRGAPQINVRSDGRGEFFEVGFAGRGHAVDLEVVDVERAERHLLLPARESGEKSKFLCGHDDRHWFVAAVPESARAPIPASEPGVCPRDEWFFVPAPGVDPPVTVVLFDEALSRGGGKAHVMQFAYRRGGQMAWVSRRRPRGISDDDYERLALEERRRGLWSQMARDPEVFAKGAIRHPDHATVVLRGWHRVAMNTEQAARAMRQVAFLD